MQPSDTRSDLEEETDLAQQTVRKSLESLIVATGAQVRICALMSKLNQRLYGATLQSSIPLTSSPNVTGQDDSPAEG